ncbi:MAG: hypothetical protein IIB09_06050, partial [Bacteroidetes bacterium]|nr:hypothetical protein [Bacteroidota bacterium]
MKKPITHAMEAEASGNGTDSYEEFSLQERRLGADTFWWAARALLRRRWFIIIATVLAGVGSIAISLVLPV